MEPGLAEEAFAVAENAGFAGVASNVSVENTATESTAVCVGAAIVPPTELKAMFT